MGDYEHENSPQIRHSRNWRQPMLDPMPRQDLTLPPSIESTRYAAEKLQQQEAENATLRAEVTRLTAALAAAEADKVKAVEAEREACARVASNKALSSREAAAAIRDRSEVAQG